MTETGVQDSVIPPSAAVHFHAKQIATSSAGERRATASKNRVQSGTYTRPGFAQPAPEPPDIDITDITNFIAPSL
ncbi:hypothetical protein BL250_08835 [Erwinia sp. OLTSP20]|nr:hypothetical protein BV501_10395 [Erwinia sp. OAMSP11]PIJ72427.1 hypothetical protein BK416_09400 [Erwinia sp. OLSSP12]PIJ80050.1 hypothetical protein BLD47_11970 [Erwinia sp. OLCASP19]PIJ82152.1 hypothetical protein BLD46_11765 [Erwinia sp. OLMTSP26]PIJ86388.1 hypothetical protein BLD49_08460 [Erwinia sp. OLMDSP33]PIJ89749.1 hypothetical protein BL249_15260 [Erwinia sp. OLFS4]PIJ92683.1 hypothetical protein BL250_08835 [Erwinia sp. OLTSP20]